MIIILLTMTAAAIAGATLPLWRPANPEFESRARGRRLLLVGTVGVALTLGAAAIYLVVGSPELVNPHAGPDGLPVTPSPTAALEQRALAAPADPVAWGRLGLAYGSAGRYADAALVFGRAARLDPRAVEYTSAEGEALTQVAGGRVTPQARTAFKAALDVDASDPRARYYLALAKEQAGDHAGAMHDWQTLIAGAPTGARWLPQVRAYVERASAGRVRGRNQ